MRRALALLIALPVFAQVAAPPRTTVQVRFLAKAEAAKALVADDYFGLLHTPELRAKTGLALAGMTAEQARSAGKAFYAASAQDFTPEEETALRTILDHAAPAIAAKMPLMARTPFSFIKAGIEGGLPHTRGTCIVLSPRVVQSLTRIAQMGDKAMNHAASLLIHEQTHVLEREHPELFAQLFTQVFGFRALASVPDSPWLAERRVVNPDGPGLGWAFPVPDNGRTRWIRPDLLIGELDHPRMPQDFQPIAVDLIEKNGAFALEADAKGLPKFEPLDGVAAYRQAFPGVDENFHPNEIAAVLFSGWVTGTGEAAAQPLEAKVAAWAEKALR